jgi:cytochrome c-type biogenesis protein
MPDVTLFMAFAAGIISFLSPCILPLVPGYLAFISGVSLAEIRSDTGPNPFRNAEKRTIVINSVFFIVGFSLVFVLLGATATWVGAWLSAKISVLSKIAGVVIIFFGIYKMGFIRWNYLLKEARFQIRGRRYGYAGAMLIGAAFAFGWTPCIGPILAGILAYAGTLQKVNQGIILLMGYCLGLGLPFLLTGLTINRFWKVMNRLKKYSRLLEIAGGIILVFLGVMILTNKLILIPAYLSFLSNFSL